jgi:SAM-dependent methyltransferase
MMQGDGAALPFDGETFDLVVESNLLHHVPDPLAVLREMRRVAKRHLILIEPNRFHPPMAAFCLVSKPDWPALRFDRAHLERLLFEARLRVVAAAPQGAVYPNFTPGILLPALARFDRPNPLGAYVTAVAEKVAP